MKEQVFEAPTRNIVLADVVHPLRYMLEYKKSKGDKKANARDIHTKLDRNKNFLLSPAELGPMWQEYMQIKLNNQEM